MAAPEAPGVTGSRKKWLTLTAMVFVVAMIFIDQTIVAIAIPEVNKALGLSETAGQWVITGYLLSLAAFFAFGGRLGDVFGHVKMVIIGTIIFAGASVCNALTPQGSASEVWIVGFRVVQGFGAALMFPAALALVINSFPLRERGRATAIFFGVAGGMTAIGPLLGGYLAEIDWRLIFLINVPIAVIGITLTIIAKPHDEWKRAPIDWIGLVFIAGGMGLVVLGLQQSSVWGWASPATIACIAGGIGMLVIFVLVELRVDDPLIRVRIFKNRMFATDNAVLFLLMMVFIPMFFFASLYAQVSLGLSVSSAGIFLLYFFIGFFVSTQISGRMLDRIGAKVPAVIGGAVGAVGFFFWAQNMTDLSVGSQWYWVIVAGLGVGFILSPASTDALNRAPRATRGEATGIVQTVRNFGSSISMAVLGTILITINTNKIVTFLESQGKTEAQADELAHALTQSGGGDSSSFAGQGGQEAYEMVRAGFAESMQVVFWIMAAIMVVTFLVALVFMKSGVQEEEAPDEIDDTAGAAARDSGSEATPV